MSLADCFERCPNILAIPTFWLVGQEIVKIERRAEMRPRIISELSRHHYTNIGMHVDW